MSFSSLKFRKSILYLNPLIISLEVEKLPFQLKLKLRNTVASVILTEISSFKSSALAIPGVTKNVAKAFCTITFDFTIRSVVLDSLPFFW